MAFARTVAHATAADGSFSAAGVAAWDGTGAHTPAVVDAVSGGIPYFSSTTAEGTSALLAAGGLVVGGGAGTAPLTYSNLTYSEASGPRLIVGSGSTTSVGLEIGYTGSSTWGGIWGTSVGTKNLNSSSFYTNTTGATTAIQASNAVEIAINGTARIQQVATAGAGPNFIMGTATTDVGLRATQTWNAAGVTFVHEKHTITDTASAAGSLAWQYLGGASGTTALASLTKGGKFEAVSYRVNGSDGVSFGPSAVASITVVNGIITAIS